MYQSIATVILVCPQRSRPGRLALLGRRGWLARRARLKTATGRTWLRKGLRPLPIFLAKLRLKPTRW